MKTLKNWKKTAIVMMTGIILTSGSAMPAMAHGHHGSSHHSNSYTGTYCAYHGKVHKKAKNCNHYCTTHHTTHKNGKCH